MRTFILTLVVSFTFLMGKKKYECKEYVIKNNFESRMNAVVWNYRLGEDCLLFAQNNMLQLFSVGLSTVVPIRSYLQDVCYHEIACDENQEHQIFGINMCEGIEKVNFATQDVSFSHPHSGFTIVDFAYKGDLFAFTIAQYGVLICDAKTGEIKREIKNKHTSGCIAWNDPRHEDYLLAVENSKSDKIEVWRFYKKCTSYKRMEKIDFPNNARNVVLDIQWHPVNENIIAVLTEKDLYIFDREGGYDDDDNGEYCVASRYFHDGMCSAISWHPFLRYEIAIAVGKKVVIWNYYRNKVEQEIEHNKPVYRVLWNKKATKPYKLAVLLSDALKVIFLKEISK